MDLHIRGGRWIGAILVGFADDLVLLLNPEAKESDIKKFIG